METKLGVKRRRGAATRNRILDAAEELFAQHGFDGCTVRQIMRKAKADVALNYYHFSSKLGLFHAVVERRAEPFLKPRLEALENLLSRPAHERLSVEEVVDAFVSPALNLLATDPKRWRNYFALGAYINSSREWGKESVTGVFGPLLAPMSARFVEALRRALPGCSDEDLFWSYHFLLGSLTMTFAQTGRIDILSGGVCRSSDLASVIKRLPVFCGAGFKAVCALPDTPITKAVANSQKTKTASKKTKTRTKVESSGAG